MVKKKPNKRGLSRLVSMFYLGCGVSVESRDDSVFLLDETYITIISYLFHAADAGSRLKFSTTAAIFSCWSTGRGATIYRFVFLCKWISGMVFSGLFNVLDKESATHADLVAVGQQFLVALYGQPTGTSITQAR